MLHVSVIAQGRVALLTALQPFCMKDATDVLDDLYDGRLNGITPEMPVVNDLRSVNLAALPTGQITGYFAYRGRRGYPPRGNIGISLCDDYASLGIARMHSILADVHQVRPEARTFVEVKLRNAVHHLVDFGIIPATEAGRVCGEIDAIRQNLGGGAGGPPVPHG